MILLWEAGELVAWLCLLKKRLRQKWYLY